jgi:hypothetical protein
MSIEHPSTPVDRPVGAKQEVKNELESMDPIYNESEYLEMDPERLFKDQYEANKISGEIDQLVNTISPAKGEYEHLAEYGVKEMTTEVLSRILKYAGEMSLATIYFENNRKEAEEILEKAFEAINNSIFVNSKGEYEKCTCGNAEFLGNIANELGLTTLARRCKQTTRCYASSDQWWKGRPAPGIHLNIEDFTVEKIVENIKKAVKTKVSVLETRKYLEARRSSTEG